MNHQPSYRRLRGRWLLVARVVWLAVTAVSLGLFALSLAPGYRLLRTVCEQRPCGPEQLSSEGTRMAEQLGILVGLVSTCVFAQVYRYLRVSGPTARQQTKWVIFGLTATLVVLLLTSVPPLFETSLDRPGTPYDLIVDLISFFAALLVPLTLGVAILRRRLFDVDLLINRALVYGLLTTTLVALYAVVVVALQALINALSGQESQLAVVASTLVIAALFNPIRRRIQTFIDRCFYRRKYDAAKTLEAYARRLREETDLEQVGGTLISVVEVTVQPEHVSLWLWERDRGRQQ